MRSSLSGKKTPEGLNNHPLIRMLFDRARLWLRAWRAQMALAVIVRAYGEAAFVFLAEHAAKKNALATG
jgi:hypothetical protein